MYSNSHHYDVVLGSNLVDDAEFGEIRWVSQLHDDLLAGLRMECGATDAVLLERWSGDRTDRDAERTRDRILEQAATLVPVLGKSFRDPRQEYGDHWDRFNTQIAPESTLTRLFKVYKTRCPYEPPPDESGGYRFWSACADGTPMEYLLQRGKKTEHVREVYRLASHIHEALNMLNQEVDSRPRVYLTGHSPGVQVFYDDVLDFLKTWCQVHTEPSGGITDVAFESAVRKEMGRCALSVHLFAGGLPLLADETRAGIQLRVARDLVDLRRLVAITWAPKREPLEDLNIIYGPFREFPENVDHLSAETLDGLKARIRARLARVRPAGEKLRVFWIVHPLDKQSVQQMIVELQQDVDGYQVDMSPDYDAEHYDIGTYKKYLDQSDAAVLCWGGAPAAWFRQMHHTLLAYLGQNCNMSLNRCAVYAAGEPCEFGTPFERIVDTSFRADPIKAFLRSLRGPISRGQAI